MTSILGITNEDDIKDLANLARIIWNEYFPPIIGQLQVDYMVEKFQSEAAITNQLQEGYEYFFICDGNERVGYTGLVPNPDKGALQISKFYLLKDARGKGHGREVITQISDMAVSSGIDQLYLTVNKYNEGAISAYKKLGFRISGDMVLDIDGGFKMDDYEMTMLLTN
ncbi:MAG: GNAT family N-acetyltransferase [Gammaproteobacteria bacterium]|nr:GNAT family N-acetyltransferase [Gammaproteobacteria bacterium]